MDTADTTAAYTFGTWSGMISIPYESIFIDHIGIVSGSVFTINAPGSENRVIIFTPVCRGQQIFSRYDNKITDNIRSIDGGC